LTLLRPATCLCECSQQCDQSVVLLDQPGIERVTVSGSNLLWFRRKRHSFMDVSSRAAERSRPAPRDLNTVSPSPLEARPSGDGSSAGAACGGGCRPGQRLPADRRRVRVF